MIIIITSLQVEGFQEMPITNNSIIFNLDNFKADTYSNTLVYTEVVIVN
jgi:hypothetical protein